MQRLHGRPHLDRPRRPTCSQHRQEKLGSDRLQFYPGRQLSQPAGLSRRGPAGPLLARHPHHAAARPDRQVGARRLSPRAGQRPAEPIDERQRGLFADHPVNVARRAAGKPPATNVWLWGLGSTPHLAPFAELYGKQGAMITAVDLLRGLAALIGWRRIDVPGATGYLDTDYAAKGRYAVEALKDVRPGLRPRRGDRRGLARRQRGGQDRGPGADRPAHRRPAARGAARLRRVSHPGLARPSHAAAHQDAQPRRRAVCDGRQRHRARTLSDSTTIPRPPARPWFSRRLAADGALHW